MELQQFSRQQADAVEHAARQLLRLIGVNPNYDLERGITNLRNNNPVFRGVSTREIISEILEPGSFRQGA